MSRAKKHITAADLRGKIIDIHSHSGISLKAFASGEYPYCQSVENLRYKQRLAGVDFTVTFPFSSELYFDVHTLIDEGRAVVADRPYSEAPYSGENRLLFTEVFEFCAEATDSVMPFVEVDPGRCIGKQIAVLEEIDSKYPIYGMKIAPVQCQSKVTELLDTGKALLEWAADRNIPVLFHVTVHKDEDYSQASDTFKVIERFPENRYCLAHCIAFDRSFLERAGDMDNVFVDTSALTIQVEGAYNNEAFMAPPSDRFDWDYSDHKSVMRSIVEQFPDTIIWGSDSPFYTFISRRMQGEGNFVEFRLKATYEDEKAALDALAPDLKKRAGSENAIAFLFGEDLGG